MRYFLRVEAQTSQVLYDPAYGLRFGTFEVLGLAESLEDRVEFILA